MAVLKIVLLFSVLFAQGKAAKQTTKIENTTPGAISSRFFDLGGIINQLFPGFNQGNQGGPVGNPPGMGFPANSQFYPGGGGASIQNTNPQVPETGGTWPVIDDASHYLNQRYPNQGPSQQYPSQVNSGMFPQQGNSMYSQGGSGNPMQGGMNPQYPQYPNQEYPKNGQGNFGSQVPQYPDNGAAQNQYPSQGSNWNQNPGQGGNWNQNPVQGGDWNQNPGQGGNWNQNPGMFGTDQGGGSLNNGAPEQGDIWNSDQPNNFDNQQIPAGSGVGVRPAGGNAVLGRPVIVPSTTTESGQIFFPSSSESAVKRQCIQDCETSTVYDPVCGSDDITYINSEKFICARNCGHNVFVVQNGRCPNEGPNPRDAMSPTNPLFFSAL